MGLFVLIAIIAVSTWALTILAWSKDAKSRQSAKNALGDVGRFLGVCLFGVAVIGAWAFLGH